MTATRNRTKWSVWFYLGIFLVPLLLAPVSLRAEFLSLADDANAMPAWQGTVYFDGTNPANTKHLKVQVDYAVYAPGENGGNFNASFPGEDPSNGGKYVYAYQLFNTGDAVDAKIMSFSVGMDGDGIEAPADINFFANPNLPVGVSCSSKQLTGVPPTSAVWSFFTTNIVPGTGGASRSQILMFTSPCRPEWDFASVVGTSATGATKELPSPTPEPASWILLGCGCGFLFLFRKKSQRKS
jgi:hypothetical protein